MNDLDKVIAFIESIHSEVLHEGEVVSVKGTFMKQEFQGISKLAGSAFQVVLENGRALVAEFSGGIEPDPETQYLVQGVLSCIGEFGLFPGIRVQAISET